MTHDLKTHPPYFQRVAAGQKRVEIRAEDDRTFAVGDHLVLREYVPPGDTKPATSGHYTGRICAVVVTDVLRDPPWVPDGYAALSIQLLDGPDAFPLTLNQYQRDNLLWLLTCLGCGADAIGPFALANSGDWVGEIAWMLAPSGRFLDGQPRGAGPARIHMRSPDPASTG